jgi:hypothetical protein
VFKLGRLQGLESFLTDLEIFPSLASQLRGVLAPLHGSRIFE